MSTSSSTAGGAMSGAQIGTQISPGWGTLIGAVVGGIAGYAGGKNAAKLQKKIDDRTKAAQESFKNGLLKEAGRAAGELYKERQFLKDSTTAALFAMKREGSSLEGEMKNNIAAADNIGSAATYVRSAIIAQENEQAAGTWKDLETGLDNIDTSFEQLWSNVRSQYHDSQDQILAQSLSDQKAAAQLGAQRINQMASVYADYKKSQAPAKGSTSGGGLFGK